MQDADNLNVAMDDTIEDQIRVLDQDPGIGGNILPDATCLGKAFQNFYARFQAVVDSIRGRRVTEPICSQISMRSRRARVL
jgi:hypothetical protein